MTPKYLNRQPMHVWMNQQRNRTNCGLWFLPCFDSLHWHPTIHRWQIFCHPNQLLQTWKLPRRHCLRLRSSSNAVLRSLVNIHLIWLSFTPPASHKKCNSLNFQAFCLRSRHYWNQPKQMIRNRISAVELLQWLEQLPTRVITPRTIEFKHGHQFNGCAIIKRTLFIAIWSISISRIHKC